MRIRAFVAALGFGLLTIVPQAAAVTYPWPVWSASIPTVPPSTTGSTWYVDVAHGSDSNSGVAAGTAFKTIAKAISSISAGDTVLVRAGLYREGIVSQGSWQGVPNKPITFGSYGDGEVILDGSTAVNGWTVVSGTVWRAPVTFTPIGVVINEIALKQVTQGQMGSTAPQVGLAGVTSGSGKWYFDAAGKFIYADVGTSIGAGDPNAADIVVPSDDGAQTHLYLYAASYVNLVGLTVRGSGSSGLWTYSGSSHITVSSCNFKFNGKQGVSFSSGSDNIVLLSNFYHNTLLNWPFGTNYNAEAGGGWPGGGISWSDSLRGIARGNIVSMGGGEGIISYGNAGGDMLFEQNVAYDNWSMNMYFDNQPGDIARDNILYRHPPNPADFLYAGNSPYPWGEYTIEKFRTCLGLSDEFNSASDNKAHLAYTQVYNNLLVGCRIGISDLVDGAIPNHGMKYTTIANNTIIMDSYTYTQEYVAGIYIQDNGANNVGSQIANNVLYGFAQAPLIWAYGNSALTGIALDHNIYYTTNASPFIYGNSGSAGGTEHPVTFAGWQAFEGQDAHSLFGDPKLADLVGLAGAGAPDYTKSKLLSGSPASGVASTAPIVPFYASATSGALASFPYSTDLTLATRPSAWDIGALQGLGSAPAQHTPARPSGFNAR